MKSSRRPDDATGPAPWAGSGRLLVLGTSARALAASAARSATAARRFPEGVTALDYFGDVDLAGSNGPGDPLPVRVLSISRDLGFARTSSWLGRAAQALDWSALAYAGGLENRPGLLRLLERKAAARGNRHAILGNPPRVVAAARDPRRLFAFLQQAGLPHAAVGFDDQAPPDGRARLLKRIRSGGGGGVRLAGADERRGPGEYFQERIEGRVGSAAFLADGRDASLLGVTEQIVGCRILGAGEYRYAGNIAGPPEEFLPAPATAKVRHISAALAGHFGLVGLNGFDFVLDGDTPRLIELNPRWTASMELFEDLGSGNLFDLHLKTLETGRISIPLPARPAGEDRASRCAAKGILYALEACTAPEPERLAALGARDRPRHGESFLPGQPLCTLVTRGGSPDECRAALHSAATAARVLFSARTW